MEICIKILEKKNKNGEDYILDQIEDKAQQKGTGKMCISSAIELECDIVGMAESVLARFISQKKDKRVAFSEKAKIDKNLKVSTSISNEDLTGAFFLCKAISYIQGSNLLLDYKKSQGWSYTISDICEVWRQGCILRCKFLDELKVMSCYEILETSAEFMKIYEDNIERLKRVCKYGVEANLYIPLFTSSLMWLNGLKLKEGNGNLIQAMRDYFGRHGVVMKNSGETVNVEWDE